MKKAMLSILAVLLLLGSVSVFAAGQSNSTDNPDAQNTVCITKTQTIDRQTQSAGSTAPVASTRRAQDGSCLQTAQQAQTAVNASAARSTRRAQDGSCLQNDGVTCANTQNCPNTTESTTAATVQTKMQACTTQQTQTAVNTSAVRSTRRAQDGSCLQNANASCLNAGNCPNDCTPKRDGSGMKNGTGAGHGRYCK